MRTSDCGHLIEAANFYAAIRSRGYFNILTKDVRSSLVIKKLRYFARYIVVSLLLKRMDLVRDLVKEFGQSLEEYSHVHEPEAQLEWSLVLQEIKSFMDAESTVAITSGPDNLSGPGLQLTLSQRLSSSNIPLPLKMPIGKLFLAEALIVGNYQRQTKFSELTVDMYRLLQILEREPNSDSANSIMMLNSGLASGSRQQINISPNHQAASKPFNLLARPNYSGSSINQHHQQLANQNNKGSPHKYLLFRPSFSQLLLFMMSGFKELPPNGVLLLYLSADGSFGPMTGDGDDAGYDLGGVATNSASSSGSTSSSAASSSGQPNNGLGNSTDSAGFCSQQLVAGGAIPTGGGAGPTGNRMARYQYHQAAGGMRSSQTMHFKQLNCVHPGDLYLFTRKPLVLIVDSNNSYAFQHMPRHFDQPLLILMSPTEYPAPFNDNTKGSLFTLFLHCPITALCSISNIIELPEPIWREAQFYMDKFYTELGQIILQSRLFDSSFMSLCSDDFLRLLIFRFIFCFAIMRLHRLFRTCQYYPRSYPSLPEAELLQHPVLKQIISDLTIALDIRSLFD